jgi:hypothetical protein
MGVVVRVAVAEEPAGTFVEVAVRVGVPVDAPGAVAVALDRTLVGVVVRDGIAEGVSVFETTVVAVEVSV